MPTEERPDYWQEAFSRLRILAANLPLEKTLPTHQFMLRAELVRDGVLLIGVTRERFGLQRTAVAEVTLPWAEVVQSNMANPFGPALATVCTKLGVPHAYR